MQIKEVMDDVSNVIGDNAMYIIIGGVVIMGLVAFMNSDEDTTLYTPTGYTSYPDADKNANTIIDTIATNQQYHTDTILGAMDESQMWASEQFENLRDQMTSNNEQIYGAISGNYDSLHGFIESGLGDLNNRVENGFLGVQDEFSNLRDDIGNLGGQVGEVQGTLDGMKGELADIKNQGAANSEKIDSVTSDIDTVKGNQNSIMDSLKQLLTPKKTTTTTTTKKSTVTREEKEDDDSSNDDSSNEQAKGSLWSDGRYFSYGDNKWYGSMTEYRESKGLQTTPIPGSQ